MLIHVRLPDYGLIVPDYGLHTKYLDFRINFTPEARDYMRYIPRVADSCESASEKVTLRAVENLSF